MLTPEKQLLVRHIREHHPNLLGFAITWPDLRDRLEECMNGREISIGFATGCLPEAGLSDVPFTILDMVHRASHAGLYKQHQEDDYLFSRHD